MKTKVVMRVISTMLTIMLVGLAFTKTADAKWNVKPSKENYVVEMKDAFDVFLINKETVGSQVGTEYYVTYTVESAEIGKVRQQGVIGTSVPSSRYPYVSDGLGGGGIYTYGLQNKLLIEGNTYFLKFTITEDGYKYRVAWAKEGESTYLQFSAVAGEVKSNLGYFGVAFCDAGINAKLTKVRFYDKKGNDLGAYIAPETMNVTVSKEDPIPKDQVVAHTYDMSIKDGHTIAISNKRAPVGNKVYMEYTVKSSKGTHAYQTGVCLSSAPTALYPYEKGQMFVDIYEYDPSKVDAGPLFVEGADYIVVFEKKADKWEATVQQTINGKHVYLSEFTTAVGTYQTTAQFFSLLVGEGPKFPINLELVDMKCYDEQKNNLGIQCNFKNAVITHYGEIEDYAGCEAVYYNDEDASLYALYADKTLKFAQGDEKKEGTYVIEKKVLTVKTKDEKRNFDYMYRFFKDEEGNTYRRLHTYKVDFVTGEGSAVEEQIIDAQDGYIALKPEAPILEGSVFEGWYTSDGKEYNFDSIVHESLTLYAKWSDTEYTVVDAMSDYLPYAAMGVGALIMVATTIYGVTLVVRRKKDEN